MTLLSVLIILLFLISLSAFIYLSVKTAKVFGALQITCLYFFFFSTWAFFLCTAVVHYDRVNWTKAYYKSKAEFEKLAAEETRLKFGDLTSTSVEDDDNALIPLEGKASRLAMDRGRAWRSIQMVSYSQAPELLVLKFDPKQIASGEASELAAKQNVEKLVVYVFAERQDPTGKLSLPFAYLGEFLVEEVQGQDMRLKPTIPLMPSQQELLNSGEAAMLTIFEMMPLDSHEAFATDGSKSTPDEIFGHMERDQLAQLFNIPAELLDQDLSRNDPNDPNVRMANLLRSYLNDGQEAAENASPEGLWTRLEFTGEHTIDVDSKEQRIATDGGYFDLSGKTVDARLKRASGEVKFKSGDSVVFGREAADEILKLGVAKPVKRIYVRPLNNYEFGFRDTRSEILQVGQQLGLLARENKVISETNLKGQEQIRFRADERQKLDKDLSLMQKERDVVVSEAKRLSSELDDLKSRLTTQYRKLQTLHSQIKTQAGMMVGAKN